MTAAPYYDDGTVTIYHGDCRDVLPHLGVADAVVTDPPYGETSLGWDRWPNGWPGWVREPVMWCFGSMRMFLEHADDFVGWKFGQDIVWEKHNGSGFHADRFKRVHEHAVQWYRGPWADLRNEVPTSSDATPRTVHRKERPPHTGVIANSTYTSYDGGPRLMRSVISVASCHGYAVHPTQKPEAILLPLIENSVPRGGLCLDPFMGAGSTLVAARSTGRRAIGIEVREEYCAAAVLRLCQGRLAVDG